MRGDELGFGHPMIRGVGQTLPRIMQGAWLNGHDRTKCPESKYDSHYYCPTGEKEQRCVHCHKRGTTAEGLIIV